MGYICLYTPCLFIIKAFLFLLNFRGMARGGDGDLKINRTGPKEDYSQLVPCKIKLVSKNLNRKKHLLLKLGQNKKILKRSILKISRIPKTHQKWKTTSLTFLKKYKAPHRLKRVKNWNNIEKANLKL